VVVGLAVDDAALEMAVESLENWAAAAAAAAAQR
jgi:hypothetical protein